jgi:hypothetical protein
MRVKFIQLALQRVTEQIYNLERSLSEGTMPDISITDFTDFVMKAGAPKITKVAEIFKRGDYAPSHDFWKPLRDHISEFHAGSHGRLSFEATGAHENKKARYDEAIKGYQKYLKTSVSEWFKPHRAEWNFEDLVIRINPEVGFLLNSKKTLVKLYFKQETLTKHRVQVVLTLMRAAQKDKSYRVGILDVVRSRLHVEAARNAQMEALLEGEAATFLGIWNSLSHSHRVS